MPSIKHVGIIVAVSVATVLIIAAILIFFGLPSQGPKYTEAYNASASLTSYRNAIGLNWTKLPGLASMRANGLPGKEGSFQNLERTKYRWVPANGSLYAAKDITYCTFRGKPLLMDIYANSLPNDSRNTGPRPMLVFVYGGGLVTGSKDNIGYDMGSMISNLAGNGFIVAVPDYRLAPEYKYPSQTQDILCAIRFLKYYSYGIGGNQNEVGIFGNSVGGQLA